jgi:hypothetical protein
MKTLLNLCSAASVVCLLAIAARSLQIPASVKVAGKPASHLRHASYDEVVFNSHARSKVVQYFDTFRADPMGLPPACAARIKSKEIPAPWENSGIAPGVVVSESERSALVEAPAELVKVLSTRSQDDVRYYLAGSNLVATTAAFKVLDSVRIPTVRLPNGNGATDPPRWDRHVASAR